MAAKKTNTRLEQLKKILEEAGYVLRFEKGNFNSGYCVLEHRKVIVINKFLDNDGCINIIEELLQNLKIENERLSPESKRIYNKILEKTFHY